MGGSNTPDEKRLEMYASIVDDDPTELTEDDVEVLERLCKSPSTDKKRKSLQILLQASETEPVLTIPALDTIVDIAKNADEPMAKLQATRILQNLKNDPKLSEYLSKVDESASTSGGNRATKSNTPTTLANNAKSDTVTAARLDGRATYFYDVTQFLQSGEQPHFVFALSTSRIVTHGCFSVDKRGSEEPILSRKTTASVVVTDHGVRIVSREGRWALPYHKITSSGLDASARRYTPTLKVVASGEIYRAKTAKSIHSKTEVSRASEYINRKI
jgi:hypothetical protein